MICHFGDLFVYCLHKVKRLLQNVSVQYCRCPFSQQITDCNICEAPVTTGPIGTQNFVSHMLSFFNDKKIFFLHAKSCLNKNVHLTRYLA